MRLGIFAKTFQRSTIEETLDAVVAHGLRCIQFNYACAGLPSLPQQLDTADVKRIAGAIQQRGLEVAAVSGTFNSIHPDAAQRDAGFKALNVIAANCAALGAKVVTLCTGTFDPNDMWRASGNNYHPPGNRCWPESSERLKSQKRMTFSSESSPRWQTSSTQQKRRVDFSTA